MAESRNPSQDQIEYVIGVGVPQRVPLKSKQVIGRAAHVDLQLDAPQLSEEHVEIVLDGQDYLIFDNDSSAGTYLAGKRLEPGRSAKWTEDQELRLGDHCRLRLILGASPEAGNNNIFIRDLELKPAEAKPGEKLELLFTVTNRGQQPDSCQIAVTGAPLEAELFFDSSSNSLTLESDKEKAVKVTIKLSESLPERDQYLLTVTVQSKQDRSQFAKGAVLLKFPPVLDFNWKIHPDKARGVVRGSFEVELENTGNRDLTIELTAQGIQSECDYEFIPNAVNLPPRHHTGVKLTARNQKWLPREGDRVHQFFVTARPHEGRSRQEVKTWEQVRPEFGLVVWPKPAEELDFWGEVKRQLEGIRKAEFIIKAVNTCPIDLALTLTAPDKSQDGRYTFEPGNELYVPVEDSAEAKLTWEKGWCWGSTKTHHFTIKAELSEAPVFFEEAGGEWVQRPNRWPLLSLILLLVAIMAAWLVFWPGEPAAAPPPTSTPTPPPTSTFTPTPSPQVESLIISPTQIVAGDSTIVEVAWEVSGQPGSLEIDSSNAITYPNLDPTGTITEEVHYTSSFTLTIFVEGHSPTSQSISVGAVDPTPTSTPNPTFTPTSTPTPAPPGVFHTFETPAFWIRGSQPYGDFTRSTEFAYQSSYAGKLEYRFSNLGSNNDGQNDNDYVVFKLLPEVALAEHPDQISAWVYGDGSCHYLNVWLRDGAGETWQFPLGLVCHTGWQPLTARLGDTKPWPIDHIEGPGNGVVEYPIRFRGLVLDDRPDSYTGTGTIYIDDLASGPATNTAAPDFLFSIAEQGDRTFQASDYLGIAIYVAVVSEENVPLAGYKVIGNHIPSGKRVESKLSEAGWTVANCLNCGYIKQGNIKFEPGNFEDGVWNIYLADATGRQLSPVISFSYGMDPSQWFWDFIVFKRNKG